MHSKNLFSASVIKTIALAAPAQESRPQKTSPGLAGEEALFQELPDVEAASLHMQTIETAAASVNIVSAADVRKYGYRMLGEALARVRGFGVTCDRIYRYAGVHGLALPGDCTSRFPVMFICPACLAAM